jgi:hypothetical protein
MQKTLIDSGPLIALFDKSDKYHSKVLQFLKHHSGELITTWSVVTEVLHMLDFNLQVQIDFIKWIEQGGLQLYEITHTDIVQMRLMMEKYIDIPIDLADASLMYLANRDKIKNIVSIDSDFDIYRTLKKQNLCNLLR